MDIPIIESLLRGLKTAKEVSDKIKDADLTNAIADLMMNAASLKMEIANLKSENHKLKEKLSEKEKYNMVFENSVYWNVKPDGTKDGAFCPTCWENQNKAIHLREVYTGVLHQDMRNNTYKCNLCKNCVSKKD